LTFLFKKRSITRGENADSRQQFLSADSNVFKLLSAKVGLRIRIKSNADR
jgi:uncharacterized protein YjbK